MTVRCGSRAGYARHLRRGEATCTRCREAHARWMAEYRTEGSGQEAMQRAGRTYHRAVQALIETHRDEFSALHRAAKLDERQQAAS